MARLSNHPAGTEERTAERRLKVLNFRKVGWSEGAIAKALGVSRATVHRDRDRTLADLLKEQNTSREEDRALELARLDAVWSKIFPLALTADIRAADVCLRYSESRRKLLGLDTPVKVELGGKDGGEIVIRRFIGVDVEST